jgi:kumamolisin
MPSSKQQVTLADSRRRQPSGAGRLKQKTGSDEIIRVTVVVRSGASEESRRNAMRDLVSQAPLRRRHMDAKEFARIHGARREDLAMIERFAENSGLQIIESSPAKRCVVLSGSVAAFNRSFGVECTAHQFQGQTYRSYQGKIRVPAFLEGVTTAVFGLDNRMLMSHHAFAHAHLAAAHVAPKDVIKAYNFPIGVKGKGQRIAIVELGGGFYKSDIAAYFKALGLRKPKISVVEIDGQKNDPSSVTSIKEMLDAMGVSPGQQSSANDSADDRARKIKALWTIETTLDIELAGSFANAAEIVVYFAPNNSQGKYQALTTALHSKKHPPTLISCSWGATEDSLPLDFVHALDQIFQDAALRGVTVCFSSGDRGDDSDKDGKPRVHFPASSPHVISCGGTHWNVSSKRLNEVVWSETLPTCVAQSGGGVSKAFDQPVWQSSASVESQTGRNGRGVPDVSGKADMAAGYSMIVGGYNVTMGGTSAVAPMWTGLIARLNQELGHNVGYLSPYLYRDVCTSAFHDITEGSNGTHYKAGPGWDPCTGLGTPHGKKLLAALKKNRG